MRSSAGGSGSARRRPARVLLEDRVHRLDGRVAAGTRGGPSASRRARRRTRRCRSGDRRAARAPARATCSRRCRARCPRSVSGRAWASSAVSASSSGRSAVSLARPKSRILTRPSRVTKTFSGFRSRWTMPLSCAAARPLRDLAGVVDGLAMRQRRCADARAQRLALEQLRDDVRRALVAADVVDGEDVGVIERAGGARLLLEAAQAVGVGRERRGQHLDGDVAAEARVARAIDLAHAAGADRSDDLVRANPGSLRQAHQFAPQYDTSSGGLGLRRRSTGRFGSGARQSLESEA